MEEDLSRLVREIDPEMNFFIPLSGDQCLIDDQEFRRLQHIPLDMQYYYRGYFLKYGGQTLDKYVTQNPQEVTIEKVFTWLHHLVMGLVLLHFPWNHSFGSQIQQYSFRSRRSEINRFWFVTFCSINDRKRLGVFLSELSPFLFGHVN